MNRDRRQQLERALPLIAEAAAKLAEARAALKSVRDDEQEAYDGLSEGRQNGDAGEAMQTAISSMDEAIDTMDMLDLAAVQTSIAAAADLGLDADAPEAKIDAKALERRRWLRLPEWAKESITRLRSDLKAANARAENMFGDPEGKPTELVIDDYGAPLHEKLLPSRTIKALALGISISVDRHGRGLLIRGDSSICIVPDASNTLYVKKIER